MRRRLAIAALLLTTSMTPAYADPVTGFLGGLISGAAGTGLAVGVGGTLAAGAASGFLIGSSIFAFGSTVVGGFILRLGLSFGLSAIARALGPKPPASPSPSEQLVNFAQPISVMEWAFGQVRKGGPYAVTSFQSDRRHYAVILAAHQTTGIDQWYIDNQPVEVVNGLVTTAPFTDFIGLRPYFGAPGQTADATLVAAIPEWTPAHNMAGLSYVAAFARRVPDNKFSEVYGNSAPTGPVITPVFRGVPVYDPRTDSVGYSNNAALVWAWATENRLGAGTVDWAKVAVEADAADVLVTNRSGGTQRKWTLNGTFRDDVDYDALAQQIVLSCDGYAYEKPDGTVGFYVGRYIAPTITLTDEDFYSIQIAEGEFGQDPATEFVAQYVEPMNDWLESPSATWVADSTERVNRQTISVPYVNSHNQAMRVLKRVARSNRAQYTATGEIGVIALELLEHRFVNVDVLGRQFIAEIGKITPGADDATFTIELSSVVPEDFDFNAATEEPAPPPRESITNDNTVAAPAAVTGVAVAGPGIEWSWAVQPIELNQQFRFRAVGATDWQPAVEITDDSTTLTTPGLVDGQAYEAELRNVTAARRPSAWVASGSVAAIANTTPPDPVTDLTATAVAGDIEVTWLTPNDPLHNATRVYRASGSGAPFSSAALLTVIYGPANTAQGIVDTGLAAGTYVYWAASANASGIESALAGPVEETV